MITLYDWQREAIDELIDGSGRVLVVAPTGGGKSMCFQQPAEELPGVAVVITPLVALMADQVAALEARGVAATYLASNLDAGEVAARTRLALEGRVKLLYVAPERLASERFVEEVLGRLDLSLLAVDEAHCISHWGHDFRPDYLQIGELVERLRPRRLIACTATATPAVRAEIVERLQMTGAKQILRGFARHNLELSVEDVAGGKAKQKRIGQELKRRLGRAGAGGGTALVYTGTRKESEHLAVAFHELGWRAAAYHAGLSGEERSAVQQRFQAGALDVVTATNAFGMGIDRADIRLVAHFVLPESVEAYYQEVGRAGRDGASAAGTLLISDADIGWRFKLLAQDGAPPELAMRRRDMMRSMIAYAETSACRHDTILRYFEDEAEALGGCGRCDNCLARAGGELIDDMPEEESAESVRAALSAIRGLPFAAGTETLGAYLIGHGSTKIRQYEWEKRDKFGVLRDWTSDRVRRLLRRCVSAGLLAVGAELPTLHATRRGMEVVAGTRPNPVRLPPVEPKRAAFVARPSAPAMGALDGAAASLFERLKEWRRRRADAEAVPAYVVLHDATLRAIAEADPDSSAALLAIPGVGPAKLERYGAQLLAELRGIAAVPAPVPPRNLVQLCQTKGCGRIARVAEGGQHLCARCADTSAAAAR